jgi:hypothetical protein
MSTLALLWLVVPVAAADYHVSPLGSDDGPGTAVQPWRTIQHGVKNATDGDTVWVGDGVYPEQVRLPQRATATGYLTIRGVNKGGATIGVGQGWGITGAPGGLGASWIKLQGLKLTGSGAGVGFVDLPTPTSVSNIVIEDCEFDGMNGTTAFPLLIHEGENVTIRRCYAHDCKRGFKFGVGHTTQGVKHLLVEDTA